MIIEKYRPEICIFVFFSNLDQATEAKAVLVEAGYDTYLFDDQETLVSRVSESRPHLIVFDPEALTSPLSQFVEEVLGASDSTHFLPITHSDSVPALFEYRDYNFTKYVTYSENFRIDLIWQVDAICEKLLLEIQNQDLLEKSEVLSSELKATKESLSQKETKIEEVESFSATQYIAKLSKASSKEDLVDFFLQSLSPIESKREVKIRAIFFKFLPTVQSLVATAGYGLDIENLKGVGGKLESEELEKLEESILSNKLPSSIEKVMKEALFVQSYQARLLKLGRVAEGVFVFWSDKEISFEILSNEYSIFLQQYLILSQQIKIEKIDTLDPVTELYNGAQYFQRLEEEIARARRLQKPVSLARLSVDHYEELKQSFGPHQLDVILKSIGLMIKKSSRMNDISFRLEDDQFALLLPHCSRKGAALRAERLRRVIESHSFTTNGFKLTVSFGVSEYPSLSMAASDLDSSSLQALEHIQSKGGNKVCLFKPSEGFQPDFEVEV